MLRARLVVVRHDDCGTCVQIAVNQTKKARLPSDILRAVLDDWLDDLAEELRDEFIDIFRELASL